MGKLGTFLLGAVTGAVGLGVAAYLTDSYENKTGLFAQKSRSNSDNDTEGKEFFAANDNADETETEGEILTGANCVKAD